MTCIKKKDDQVVIPERTKSEWFCRTEIIHKCFNDFSLSFPEIMQMNFLRKEIGIFAIFFAFLFSFLSVRKWKFQQKSSKFPLLCQISQNRQKNVFFYISLCAKIYCEEFFKIIMICWYYFRQKIFI